MTSRQLKDVARQQFKSNWASHVIVTIIFLVLILGLNSINVLTFPIGLLLSIPIFLITNALQVLYLTVIRDYIDGNYFSWISYIIPWVIRDAIRMAVAKILQVIYLFLWSLLLLIPGIYKALSYALVNYVLVDFPELTANEAITMSRRLMRGQKLKFIGLHLRFFWWYILVMVTFGVAFVYVQPYITVAMINFYNDCLAQHDTIGEIETIKYQQVKKQKRRSQQQLDKYSNDEDEWKNF